jgi:hypothetical protein
MQAYKMLVTIPETRRLEVALPSDAPAGPAEVIILIPRAEPLAVVPWPFVLRRMEEGSAAAHPAGEAVPQRVKQRAAGA